MTLGVVVGGVATGYHAGGGIVWGQSRVAHVSDGVAFSYWVTYWSEPSLHPLKQPCFYRL